LSPYMTTFCVPLFFPLLFPTISNLFPYVSRDSCRFPRISKNHSRPLRLSQDFLEISKEAQGGDLISQGGDLHTFPKKPKGETLFPKGETSIRFQRSPRGRPPYVSKEAQGGDLISQGGDRLISQGGDLHTFLK